MIGEWLLASQVVTQMKKMESGDEVDLANDSSSGDVVTI